MEKSEVESKYNSIKRNYSNNELESVKKCRLTMFDKTQNFAQARLSTRLTIPKAQEDVNHFFNCLKLCYSGFDTFLSDKLCTNLEKKLLQKLDKGFRKTISNELLCKYLYKALFPYIHESHFMLSGGRITRYFSKPYIAQVADVVLKETESGYLVVNKQGGLKENTVLNKNDVKNFLMPTLYPGKMESQKDKFFLLGEYSLEKRKFIEIAGKKLKLHRIKSDFVEQKNLPRFDEHETYAVANHQSYQFEQSQALFDEFKAEGRRCSTKETVILNLLGNRGGSDYFPDNFFDGLAGNHFCKLTVARLQNPFTLDNSEVKYEVYDIPKEKEGYDFKGQLYVLMNKLTASSGEDAIAVAKNISETIFIGSASSGCGTFGDCIHYQLPNSKIIFYFGYKYFAHPDFEEGKGYLPDYWIDSKNPLEVIEKTMLKY